MSNELIRKPEHLNPLPNRRRFLKYSSLSMASLAVGLDHPTVQQLVNPWAVDKSRWVSLPDKHPEMTVLNDRPINAEAPAHLLDQPLTSGDRFFVRNNGIPPDKSTIHSDKWTLTIGGESVVQPKTYTLRELKSRFQNYTYQITLECGGNGRKEFNPPAKGNQWSVGAVGCAAWTGIRLKDLLDDVGIQSNAVYIGYYGKDTHLTGDPNKQPISRGVPIQKAMENESLIAWDMNGEPLPYLNGYPLRLVFGGYPASCSGKWLSKIVVRDKVHDGAKMAAPSYRIPCEPVAPGAKVPKSDMCIIEAMPVKSLLTFPKSGAILPISKTLPIRGHAWAGALEVQTVQYSIDFGATWQPCALTRPANRFAWQHFSATIRFPQKGYYEIWAKATDSEGKSQPMILPNWNPKGYLNNACHRIAVKVV
ncbi:MAG: sulfite oxidase [Bacteroidota bacterium]